MSGVELCYGRCVAFVIFKWRNGWLEDLRIGFRKGKELFSVPFYPHRLLEPTSYALDIGNSFTGVKASEA